MRDRATPTVRALDATDDRWKRSTLEAAWGSTLVARLGEAIDAADLPGFVAVDGDEAIGLVTCALRHDGLEIVTIQALLEGQGVARALMDRVLVHGRSVAAGRLWLVTTNDNTRAFRFYQRWGMDLALAVVDGVAESRRVKPSIPTVGNDGIPLRHELVFERLLEP